jgi:hypothetical protein
VLIGYIKMPCSTHVAINIKNNIIALFSSTRYDNIFLSSKDHAYMKNGNLGQQKIFNVN